MRTLIAVVLVSSYMVSSIPAQAGPAAPSPAPSASVSATPAPVLELVKGETPVDVTLVKDISSRDVTQGTTVDVEVERDVVVNGMVVISKAATGQATLTKVQGAGGNGNGGKIEFAINWVRSEDGGKVELSDNSNASENADKKGEASTLAIAGYLTFGVLGLFSHNFAHGKDAVISKDKVFHAFVDHDVHVATSQADLSQPGFDH